MKKFLIVLIVLICCLVLSACSPSAHPSSETQELETTRLGISLEPNKQSLPSQHDFDAIVEGMTYEEVYALVGNPQLYHEYMYSPSDGAGSSAIIFHWHIYMTSDGTTMGITFGKEGDTLTVISCVPKDLENLDDPIECVTGILIWPNDSQ